MKRRSYIYIIAAAALWGIIGVFVNGLSAAGFSRPQIVFLRVVFAAVTMLPVMFFCGKDSFKIRLKDIWCFMGTGTVSLLLFNVCYFYSMQYNGSMAVAAILLYTAPAFVTVMSSLLFKEKFTANKIISLIVMFAGCVFVSGVFSGGGSFSPLGILFGIGSGIGYALYSVFGRYAILRGYKSQTISFYTFVFACAGALFICNPADTLLKASENGKAVLLSLGIGFVCCVLPYIFYTKGMETTDNSTASILATAEPLVASVTGVCFYGDKVTMFLIVGIVLIISGIIIMNSGFKMPRKPRPRFFEIFYRLCEIPRGSGNTEKAADFICSFAKKNGLRYIRDSAGNVVIFKPRQKSGGKGSVILQAHIDMVCEKTEDSVHDFKSDKIIPVEKNGFLVSRDGTTLGADDGIGAAYIMAVLENRKISHPDIEAVFTADEETGMCGAAALDTSVLKSEMLINLDSEEENRAIIGCAGGASIIINSVSAAENVNGTTLKIEISGLLGGHSGEQINKNRANAYRELFLLLGRLKEEKICRVGGGGKDNTIARYAFADIQTQDRERTILAVEEFEKERRRIFEESDGGYRITVSDCECKSRPVGAAEKFRDFINFVPNGVTELADNPHGFVKTSLNLGFAEITESGVQAVISVRSSSDSAKAALIEKITSAAASYGLTVKTQGEYPGWEPVQSSPLQKAVREEYRKIYGREIEIQAIHAGLECGLFSRKIQNLDAVSIGPDIKGAHTPQEALSVKSAERVYNLLLKILERIQ